MQVMKEKQGIDCERAVIEEDWSREIVVRVSQSSSPPAQSAWQEIADTELIAAMRVGIVTKAMA